MSPRDRIRHLYRRLGFGATPAEVDAALKDGFEATRKRLVDYPKTPPGPAVDPQEFVWREKEEPDLGTYRYAIWWYAEMLATPRPLEQKLTVFWHDHFAVSDGKVENGPMMLSYLRTLKKHAGGRFGDLLKAVSKEPAMMRYLDMNRQVRGVPNENFAREVMELFTLGIGHYSENDVQEASRAFTGWGFNELFWELPGNTEQKLRESIKYDRPFAAFYNSPAMHDPTPKTILGKTAPYDGDEFLDMLAAHPQTARTLCAKLWTYFAYDDPEPKVVNDLAAVWKKTDGDILAVVDALTKRPEFYSDRCVRSRVKCPVDLVVSVARQSGVGSRVYAERNPKADPTTRIPDRTMQIAGEVGYIVGRMGMPLLYPPDVSGWEWGTAWTGAALMAERMKFHGVALWREKSIGESALGVHEYLMQRAPKTPEQIAAAFIELYDVPIGTDRIGTVAEAVKRGGGVNALAKPESVAGLLWNVVPVLMAAPEMHLA